MIKKIRIRNFKSLQDVEVPLSPFTVLIGPNGGGKSSFLQSLQILSWLINYGSINDALEINGLTYNELVYLRASSSRITWFLDLEVPDCDNPGHSVRVSANIGLAKHKHVYVSHEWVVPEGSDPKNQIRDLRFFLGRHGRKTMLARERGLPVIHENVTLAHSLLSDVRGKADQFPILSAVADELGGFIHYEIWGPESLRKPSSGEAPTLAERGQNLPSVLYRLRSKEPEKFQELTKELRASYKWLDAIEFKHLAERGYGLSFLESARDKRRRRVRYEPSQVSDGFLRLLALTTIKYHTHIVPIIGYEEPENGMHPAMLTESVRRLRDVARRGTQVIITTHSPLLLQYLLSEESGGSPEKELRLVWRDEDGKTVIQPPDPEVLKKARDQHIGLGELWALLLDEKSMASRA